MAASDYVPTFFKKPLALGGASTDEYTPRRFALYAIAASIAVKCYRATNADFDAPRSVPPGSLWDWRRPIWER
jgi:hypothetical protein